MRNYHWLVNSLVFLNTIHPFSCFNVFVRVKTATSVFVTDEEVARGCARTCTEMTNTTTFCFGFAFTTRSKFVGPILVSDGNCKFNTVPEILQDFGDYYMMVDYRSTVAPSQCADNYETALQAISFPYGDTITTRIFNGSLFLFDSVEVTGGECRKRCEGFGMHVTSIHSEEENEFIRATVVDLYYPGGADEGAHHYGHICHVGYVADIGKATWAFADRTPYDFDKTIVTYAKYLSEKEVGVPADPCGQMRNLGDWITQVATNRNSSPFVFAENLFDRMFHRKYCDFNNK